MTRRVENAVILTGSDCALIYEAAHIRDLRIAARGKSERLYSLLTDLTAAAFAHQASPGGTKPQEATENDDAGYMEMTTVESVAKRSGVTPRTIRNHIGAGLLEATKINRTWVITAQAAEKYIAGRTNA